MQLNQKALSKGLGRTFGCDRLQEDATLRNVEAYLRRSLSRFATIERISNRKLGIDGANLSELQDAIDYAERMTRQEINYQTGNMYDFEVWIV